jgi:methanogenic corrinoid protein MtbC1
MGYHLTYLAESLAASDPSLFTEYVEWVKALFANLGFADDALLATLDCTQAILREKLDPAISTLIDEYLSAGLVHAKQAPTVPPGFLHDQAPLYTMAKRYLSALLEGKRHVASEIVLNAVSQGVEVRDIYLYIFQPVQYEVGRLWQTNQISVAQEHYCTAATQLIMSQLYPHIFRTERAGHTLVATCIGGELHELGVRMVADFFEMEGWDTYYLGANTPAESILQTLAERQADILGISATITFHVSDVERLIGRIRTSDTDQNVQILVGGYPFNTASSLWQQVGADGHARDAQEAIALANRMVGAV